MNDNDAERELLGAWALDAVDDVERAALERAIRADPELAEEARTLRETAALLAADGAVKPPAGVRDNVLAAVAETAQQNPRPSPPQERRARRANAAITASGRHRRARWLAAAAILLVAAIPTGLAVQQAQRAQRAENEVTALAEALARPDAQLLGANVEGGGRAVAVVTDEVTIFAAQDLPALTDQRVYQLWIVDQGEASSAGVMQPEQGLVSTEIDDLPADSVLAITVEPAGGSEQPTTTPIVALPTGI
ncbi:anti-sigma factor domain-containing protein [Georgenia sp. AZ-5]|uniref:anti-sigma factor n=1 Tax=Georgenia sp. AZ-5 TaxID=3367526 RepID=UPI0037542010